MKKIIIILTLIFINTQIAFGIQGMDATGSSTQKINSDGTIFMGESPSFDTMNKQLNQNYFIPAKTEAEKELEEEKETEYRKNQEILITEEFDRASTHSRGESIKPIQLIRLKIKKRLIERKARKNNKDLQSQINDNEEIENEVETEEKEIAKLLLECKEMEYLTDKKELQARGGTKLTFPEKNFSAIADEMIYNQEKGLVKMTGNVILYRGEDELTGEYMQIDLNEEISVLNNMKSAGYAIETIAEKGMMIGDKVIQEKGHLTVAKPFKIQLRSGLDTFHQLKWDNADKYTYEDLFHNSKFVIKSNHIIVDSKNNFNKITVKKLELYKDGKRVLKLPSMTMYQNKGQDYFDGNYVELGSRPKQGLFIGPGFIVELPKNSILKLVPMLNYSGGIGVGGYARYRSATNTTEAMYGTAKQLFMVNGRQELDKNLYANYGMNSYIRNGWLGRGWAKYAFDLNYEKRNTITNFMGKQRPLHFEQMISAGYIQDDGKNESYDSSNKNLYDKDHNKLTSYNIGTMRFRYMINAYQNLYHYENPEKLIFTDFYLYTQGAATVYGTGDTQFIGRIGPMIRSQCKYWMQDVGFFVSAYQDNTPIPLFDAFRFGKLNAYLREGIKLGKLFKVTWYGSANLSNDAPNGKILQESRFMFNFGPDDMNIAIGWDAIRQGTYFGVNLDLDAKSTEVYYDKLEIKNMNNFGNNDPHGLAALEKEDEKIQYNVYQKTNINESNEKSYLTKCQIINIEDSSLKMEKEPSYDEYRKQLKEAEEERI